MSPAAADESPADQSLHPDRLHYERSYDPPQPAYALEGYLHHVDGAIVECDLATDHVLSQHPGKEANTQRFELNGQFVQIRNKYQPFILRWHNELVGKSRDLGLLPEVSPLLDRTEAALENLFEGAAETRLLLAPKLSDKKAFQAAKRKASRGREKNNADRIDESVIRNRIKAARITVERLRKLWPHFDPAKERVDRALVPWERAYDLADQINDTTSELIQKTAADSIERIRGSERLTALVEQDLKSHWNQAVQHALTDDLATRIDAAFLRVRDAAREATANSIRMRQRGDQTWATVWGRLNDAVLAMQDLRPLLRRAVLQARGNGSRKDPSAVTESLPIVLTDPWFPAKVYRQQFGIPATRLRRAVKDERIESRWETRGAKKRRVKVYRFSSVKAEYPEDVIFDPPFDA